MIGVVARAQDLEVIREFFELFKTPWEPYRRTGKYDVVAIFCDDVPYCDFSTEVIVVYAAAETCVDREYGLDVSTQPNDVTLSYRGRRLPIYGKSAALSGPGTMLLQREGTGQSVGSFIKSGAKVLVRFGYDLSQEVRFLLTNGQPIANAQIQTLELHIAVLRDAIVASGTPLVEIPPVPEGYHFIACLTHDIDHPSIRRHRWNHTMFGFLHRALLGSVSRVLAGRITVRDLIRNWKAAAKLPLVHLGLAKDTWSEFDRYLDLESDLASTFFALPFGGEPGKAMDGEPPYKRASSYGAADIAEVLRRLVAAGSEVGVHGLDAWTDSALGRRELDEIVRLTGSMNVGVRMHWLYWDASSASKLEEAGFSYDSTVAYNETIGYRAGTSQVFKLPGTRQLLELPLHIMDTAMFYPRHLNLAYGEAEAMVRGMIDGALEFGGALTINWHDRSIAPERLWGDFYIKLLAELRSSGAWCTSAGRAVRWFRKRRSATLQRIGDVVEVKLPKDQEDGGDELPALRLRIHHTDGAHGQRLPSYVDSVLSADMRCALDAKRMHAL